ncbi:MAG TPA: diguanylate cyclase [Rhodopila sp.]|nr:diguanylate cyclase [Rhodopila sp.]
MLRRPCLAADPIAWPDNATRSFADLMPLAIEGSGTGLWDRNVKTGEIWYSPSWKAILGHGDSDLSSSIEEAYGRIHPDDLSYVQAAMQAHFDGQTPSYEVEHRLRCKDGSWKWVLSRGKVISRDVSGHALRMVGTTTDITATRSLAEQLRRKNDLIINLTNEIPGFVFQYRLGSDGCTAFSFVSKGIDDTYEVSAHTALESATSVLNRIHPEDREAYQASLIASAADLSPWHIEYRVLLPRQGLRWHQADGKPSRQPDGGTIWHGIIIDISDRKHAEEELKSLARIDFLTQLPNRRYFHEKMEVELHRIRRAISLQAAVIMLDIDHFKSINDRHGHAAGDAVIRHFADLLRSEIRRQDAAGRLGGEEFAIVLSGIGSEEAGILAMRLRRRIAEAPAKVDDQVIPFTVSFGITAMTYADDSPDAPLARADTALYQAKQAGRDRIEYFLAAEGGDSDPGGDPISPTAEMKLPPATPRVSIAG